MNISKRLFSSLRKGCVCQIKNEEYAEYLHHGIVALTKPEKSIEDRQFLLSFLTFCRSVIKLCLNNDFDEDFLCKKLQAWLILLRKLKFYLLKGCYSSSKDQDLHLSNLAQDTFNHLFALLPCPMISSTPEDSCSRLCHRLLDTFCSSKLAKFSFHDIENKPKFKMSSSGKCSTTSKIHVLPCQHSKTLNKILINKLKSHWKLSWIPKFNDESLSFRDKAGILSLWKCLVDVKSNMTLHQMREFVSSVDLSAFKKEPNALLKRKHLEIFNEILCYGSTLGIQSDVPAEVSEVAHQIVRLSASQGLQFQVPQVHLGLAGDQILEDCDSEQVPDLIVFQGIVLLHLKSVALLVREAQSCSSSDESDSSLSSRGSSSIAEEDAEMKMIEKNVVQLLIQLRFWINDCLGLPSCNSLNSAILTLFNESDDGLIEALLCLLDTHCGIQYGSYSARIGLSATCLESDDDAMDFFHPIDAFEQFLANISHDSSVLLDFLLSNETCFLLYFLRILKYLNRKTIHPARENIMQTLKKVAASIKKLTEKNLFPYDIKPVQKQLEKLVLLE